MFNRYNKGCTKSLQWKKNLMLGITEAYQLFGGVNN